MRGNPPDCPHDHVLQALGVVTPNGLAVRQAIVEVNPEPLPLVRTALC